MSAAAAKKMDDSGPQNWVVPEVMKPEEKELVEKLTQVMSKNTFHRAKEATRLARYENKGATLDDLREAVTTLEEMERTARRVFGGAHPIAVEIEKALRLARAALRAREETPSGG